MGETLACIMAAAWDLAQIVAGPICSVSIAESLCSMFVRFFLEALHAT